MKKSSAFTLAEVLITLGIIGIVAAMTLPSLIAKYQNKILANQAKKSYSMLLNALNLTKVQMGGTDYSLVFTNDYSGTDSRHVATAKKILGNMRVLRYCGSKPGCFTPRIKKSHKEGNINSETLQLPNWATAILNDGTSIAINQYNYKRSDCYIEFENTNEDGEVIGTAKSKQCGAILIDVNGLKGPNQYGADIFSFVISPDKIRQYRGDLNSVLTSETFDYDPTIPDIFEQ